MRSTELDRQVELLAAKQHGAFSRRQAFDLGATDRFVHRRLAQRHWLRQVAGVYVLPNSAGTWFRQCKVAELSVDSSALAGRAAAALLGIPGFRHGPIELVGPANANHIHPFAIVHRYAGAKLTVVEGIRTTTYAQTLFDVAPRTNVWGLERGIDDGLISKRVTVGELSERLSFYNSSRREGLAKIRPFIIERLEDGWIPPESELEALLHATLGCVPSRPRIVRQASFPWRSTRPGRVDVLLPDHRLIIEADGRRWHSRVADFDNDRWRDNEAVAHGHRVMRFTWLHLHDLVDEVIDLVERTVRPASAA